jgi:hypothetical protein
LTGIAVSGHSKIYRTTDGGETWTVQQIGYFRQYTHIHFLNSTIGWISGSHGFMLRTTDAGITWNEVYIGTHQTQNVVYFFDENNGFLAGNMGMLLHTSNGGYTPVNPAEHKKSTRNELTIFPNPASLQITLVQGCKIAKEAEITVFDLDGREILVEKIHSGINGTSLDISGLVPGVYICKFATETTAFTTKFVKQ